MIEWEDGTAVRSAHITPTVLTVCISQGKERCQIWAKPLNDGSVAVALFNSVSNTKSYVQLQMPVFNHEREKKLMILPLILKSLVSTQLT